MSVGYDRLTLEMIDQSPEINRWVDHFPSHRQPAAVDLLLKLQFIRRDVYADWLKNTLSTIDGRPCAYYAVRKFEDPPVSYWDAYGNAPVRPATSQGSEELVQSTLGNMRKAGGSHFLDHPSITELKTGSVRNLVLIDDSLGTGQRVTDFLLLLMKNRTIMSWWSYGLLQFHVVAFIRTRKAEETIRRHLPGSDHPKRTHRKSAKIHFVGHHYFDHEELQSRWGANADQILDLCDSEGAIPAWAQRGYGKVMSNAIFYHSVPDNIPGILWCTENGWLPLFPNRSFPVWMTALLAGQSPVQETSKSSTINRCLLALLMAVQKGIRTKRSISGAIGLDPMVTEELMQKAQIAGLLSQANRLTKAGGQAIRDSGGGTRAVAFDRSLYVPTKWCVGRGTVQPFGPIEETRRVQTESSASLLAEDGDTGQVSLDRTDARSAAPPLSVVTQQPAGPRVGDDAHGPEGRKG